MTRFFSLLLVFIYPLYGSEYTINIHVIKRTDIESLLYRAVPEIDVETVISRIGVSFHSERDKEKDRETYAIDHCNNPGYKPIRSILTLKFRGIVKRPSPTA